MQFVETHTQTPKKLNVGCWESYYGPCLLRKELDRSSLFRFNIMLAMFWKKTCISSRWTPPHYFAAVMQLLDQYFPHKWVGVRGPLESSARSPDLTPSDFFHGTNKV